ncbi:MAG: M42 family metallopeptidase [Stecheria intestinalis]|nr:M42 family metallopeptidase [Stecheria intestinalis]
MEEIERIIALSNAFGPSGFEDEVSDLVKDELSWLEPEEDHMRNVRAVLNPDDSGKPKVMLDSHLDEVGVIVQAVKPDGTMKFLKIGGISDSSFPSSRFRLRNRDGKDYAAIVAAKPPHFMTAAERLQPVSFDQMVLDAGTCSREETERMGLGIASPGVPDVTCTYDEGRQLFEGKAFDCRIGVAAEIQTLAELQGKDLPCVVQGAFSVQEEVGERGVYANYKALKPDVMIAFEGCPADDTFQEPYLVQAALRKGPMLRHFDVSMITNPHFQKLALDLAVEEGIPVQESVRSGGGTDGGRIYPEGVPSIVIGIPVRYIHSGNCWCTYQDYRAAVDLAVTLVSHLDQNTVDSL